jgi:hypothetical protein
MEILSVETMDARTLDYYVARAENITHPKALRKMAPGFVMVRSDDTDEDDCYYWVAYQPTLNWAVGGAIIEEEKIGLDTWQGNWAAQFSLPRYNPEEKFSPSHHRMRGDSALIAAMRTYVASKFGAYFTEAEDGTITTVDRPERTKVKPAPKQKD